MVLKAFYVADLGQKYAPRMNKPSQAYCSRLTLSQAVYALSHDLPVIRLALPCL